jgi:MFS family permease
LLYGTAAALVFNRLFFPTFDPAVGTLAALATFAVGFAARPVGGVLFGHFGDTRGRKSMLVVTLLLMGVATTLIGLLPTYEQVGFLAPILLVALRLCQGVGLGGEWGAAVVIAVEHAPAHRRGFYGSWPQLGAPAGVLLGNLAFLAVAGLPEAQLLSWGWRVPFLLSLILVVVGLLVRRAVPESPAFTRLKAAHAEAKQPLVEVVGRQWRQVMRVIGARGAEIGIVTVLNTFILGYATATLGVPRPQAIAGLLIATLLVLILVPVSGALSDRVGRRNVYLVGALAATVLVIPACLLIDSRQAGLLTLGLMLGMLGPGVMTGPQGSFFAELFGVHVRYTGASLGFQLGAALIGGLAPVVAASVALAAGNLLPVGIFMLGLGLVTIACVWATAETYSGKASHDGQR